jgi:hypothetical protein
MAIPANAFLTTTAIGIREHLLDAIYNVTPEDVPVMTMAGREDADQKYVEWQTDALRASNANNAALEGDDLAAVAAVPTVRVGNRTQIFTDVAIISDSNEASKKAGRNSEMNYQVSKRITEMKRDMEAAITSNNASVIGTSGVAGKLGGLEAWIPATAGATASAGVGYVNGGFAGGLVTAATDGTQRTFTEVILKASMAELVGRAGMKNRSIVMGPGQKQVFSTFAGIALNRYQLDKPKMGAIIGAAEVYQSDFGMLTAVVDLHVRTRTALIIDPDLIALAYLIPFKRKKRATLGINEGTIIETEATLIVRNPAGLSKSADLL